MVALACVALLCGGTVAARGDLAVTHPPDGAVFPPGMPPPAFAWSGGTGTGWIITVACPAGTLVTQICGAARWVPTEAEWARIDRDAREQWARIEVEEAAGPGRAGAGARTVARFRVSNDEVGAPLFYREVNLPFSEAVKDPTRIRWRFGPVASRRPPPVVLEGLPVCANCHSFSSDGRTLAMDVDYANDKGSYAILDVGRQMVLARTNIITWSDYRREDRTPTFGLLSQISPDGRFVLSTVKDRSVFVARPELAFSQLFFPIKGIVGLYDRQTRRFSSLRGADDPAYVQSNPTWSPDGRQVVFARCRAHDLKGLRSDAAVMLTQDECREFLRDGRTFLFDLYRVPFDGGRGGQAVAVRGASTNGFSNYFPRHSPDGRWIVFCRSRSFMLLQPDSELWIIPSEGGEARRLACNTARMNSWHTWSPNGRWLVFSSKANRDFTQLFIAHMDGNGESSPPVVLDRLTEGDRAANIPEFVAAPDDAIAGIRESFLDAVSYVRAGNELRLAGELDAAARKYEKALALDERNADACRYLGFIAMMKGDLPRSREWLLKAIRFAPGDPEPYSQLAVVMAQQGKPDDAEKAFRAALALAPDYAVAHAGLGMLAEGRGRRDEAMEHYAAAVRHDASMTWPLQDLGRLLMQSGRLDEAAARILEALRREPGDRGVRVLAEELRRYCVAARKEALARRVAAAIEAAGR